MSRESFEGKAQAIGDFKKAWGRWPRHARGGDESVLADWLARQQHLPLSDPRRDVLDEVCPGWVRPAVGRVFADKVGAVAQFRLTLDRWPAAASADPNERGLGLWLRRARRTPKTTQQLRLLAELVPGWATAPHFGVRFVRTVEAAVEFRATCGAWPRPDVSDAAERNLAARLAALAAADLLGATRSELDRLLPGWDSPSKGSGRVGDRAPVYW